MGHLSDHLVPLTRTKQRTPFLFHVLESPHRRKHMCRASALSQQLVSEKKGKACWGSPPGDNCLPFNPQEFRRRPPENLDPVLVTEPGNHQNMVDGGSVPWERVIGPKDHMIDPCLGDQVPHALAGEHDRIEIELSASEIFGRLLLWQGPNPVRESRDYRVRAIGVGRQEPATMRGAD